MVTEDYCSFELSKLLKEKGFDVELQCDSYYEETQKQIDIPYQTEIDGLYPHCTHALTMKWLREKHNLHIEVIYNPYYEEYKGCMYKTIGEYNYTEFYSTYEEAVESAIKYSLEKLI